jgi:protein phosphatase PTC7
MEVSTLSSVPAVLLPCPTSPTVYHVVPEKAYSSKVHCFPFTLSSLLPPPLRLLRPFFPHDAGMRRSVLRSKFACAILPHPRRALQTSPCCLPGRAFATSTTTSTTPGHDPPPVHDHEIPPFHFETGLALFAKRTPRPFPPPFLSPPSGSFSDPLSTHHRSRDRRTFVDGELIRGYTNGDDAVYVSDMFIGANDGVGAWSTRPGGHAG